MNTPEPGAPANLVLYDPAARRAGRAVVLLGPLAARLEAANGQASPMSGSRGDVFWTDGYIKHRGSNIGSRPSEMIIVEVK